MAIFSFKQEEVFSKGYGPNVRFLVLLGSSQAKQGDTALVEWSKAGLKEYRLMPADPKVPGAWFIMPEKAYNKLYAPAQQAPLTNPQPVASSPAAPPAPDYAVIVAAVLQALGQAPAQPAAPVQNQLVTPGGVIPLPTQNQPTKEALKAAKVALGLTGPGRPSYEQTAKIHQTALQLMAQGLV